MSIFKLFKKYVCLTQEGARRRGAGEAERFDGLQQGGGGQEIAKQ